MLAYNHWIISTYLMKKGIPWDAIQEFSVEDTAMILGVLDAVEERENEQQETINRMSTPRF